MIEYDARIIYQFADALYRQARSIVLTYTLIGFLLGGVGGFVVAAEFAAIAGALILGLLGYVVGQQRAFQLKLQAQIALCQVRIEENTRPRQGIS